MMEFVRALDWETIMFWSTQLLLQILSKPNQIPFSFIDPDKSEFTIVKASLNDTDDEGSFETSARSPFLSYLQ